MHNRFVTLALFGLLAVGCFVVILPLAFWATESNDREFAGQATIYRPDSRRGGIYWLAFAVFFLLLAAIGWTTFPPGHPAGWEIALVAGFCALPVGVALMAYVSLRRNRIEIRGTQLLQFGLIRRRVVDLREVAAIITMDVTSGRGHSGTVLTLVDRANRSLLHVASCGLDFGALVLDIETRTRSPEVTLYRCTQYEGGWAQRPNLEHGVFKPCKAPVAMREKPALIVIAVLLGLVLVAVLIRNYYLLRG